MIKYIIKSTYKTYHGKIGYFFLLLLIIGNLIHSWLLGNIWPESIYDPIVGFDLQVFAEVLLFLDVGAEVEREEESVVDLGVDDEARSDAEAAGAGEGFGVAGGE